MAEPEEGERDREEMYEESCRRYAETQRGEIEGAWRDHYARMRAVHWGLGDEYDEKLRRLEDTA